MKELPSKDKFILELINENIALGENKKTEWFSCAWHLKSMFDKGLIKGFSNEDFTILKFININYNRARQNKYKDESFEYWMFGDLTASKLSDAGFKKIKQIYKENKEIINTK